MLVCVAIVMPLIRYLIVHLINWRLSKRFVVLFSSTLSSKIKIDFPNVRIHFQSLITFVNKHLNKLNFEVANLNSDFKDGVYMCLLMGLLGGFFVPLYDFHLTPKDAEQMVNKNLNQPNFSFLFNRKLIYCRFINQIHNVAFSFELMQDVGLPKPKARPEDIVNMDLKSTLRVLYSLFTKYRNVA